MTPKLHPALRLSSCVIVGVLFGLLTAPSLHAEPGAGVHVGFNVIADDFFFGAHGKLPFARISSNAEVVFYPNIDLYLVGDATVVAGDIDLIIPVEIVNTDLSIYAGLGFGVSYVDHDPGTETIIDFNIPAGVVYRVHEDVAIFLEAEAAMYGNDSIDFALGGTYLF